MTGDAAANPVAPHAALGELYCPQCQQEVKDPLACGDCLSIICRKCGTPLERVDELGIG
jgi:uncharacterized Zn finger protein (UPF0148 family)